MHYNNWSMYLTQFMACEGYFKNCSLTLMHGALPRLTENWGDEFMALFLNDRVADWIARYELKDSYPYRIGERVGVESNPRWGITTSDLYYTDFDRAEDQMRINLSPGTLLDSNPDWLNGGQPKPTWFVVALANYGPAQTHYQGGSIRMVGKLGVMADGSVGSELVRMIRLPEVGQFPTTENLLSFTVPIGG